MSAYGRKPDMQRCAYLKTDMTEHLNHVRFVPNSDVACLIGSEAIIQTDTNDVELIAKGCVER